MYYTCYTKHVEFSLAWLRDSTIVIMWVKFEINQEKLGIKGYLVNILDLNISFTTFISFYLTVSILCTLVGYSCCIPRT